MNEEINLFGMQLRQKVYEVLKRPSQSIDGPYHDHIKVLPTDTLPE